MKSMFNKFFNFFKPKQWVVRKCGFPYPEGYCTYNKEHNMLLDTGLTKEQAKSICKELNKR